MPDSTTDRALIAISRTLSQMKIDHKEQVRASKDLNRKIDELNMILEKTNNLLADLTQTFKEIEDGEDL